MKRKMVELTEVKLEFAWGTCVMDAIVSGTPGLVITFLPENITGAVKTSFQVIHAASGCQVAEFRRVKTAMEFACKAAKMCDWTVSIGELESIPSFLKRVDKLAQTCKG